MFGKSKEQKEEARRVKELKALQKLILSCQHIAGLPVAEGAYCTISFDATGMTVNSSNGSKFSLAIEKISDVSFKIDTEVETAYVSSAGGAVAGALLLGPLGAAVGGRTKKKETTQSEWYFIVTYLKENEPAFLTFLVPLKEQAKMINVIGYFRPLIPKQNTTIEL